MAKPKQEKKDFLSYFSGKSLPNLRLAWLKLRLKFSKFKLKLPKLNRKLPKLNFKVPKFGGNLPKLNRPLPKSNFMKPASTFNLTSVLSVLFIFFACLTMITTMIAFAKHFSENKTASAAPVEEEYIPAVVTPNFDNQIKVLLLGSDIRPNDGSYRTDAILMIVLDPDLMKINVVSFPRDLWVQVPGLWEMKINQVMQLGGFDAVAGMFEANFGLRPDYYVMTNFNGFKQFIDNRGGVDVNVASDFSDTCDLPQQDANGDCNVSQGVVHMDGPTALWYVRARTTSNDLDRTRREQEVLFALAKKLISVQSITQLSSMKNEIEENVQTNMTIDQAIKLMPFVGMVLNQPDKIHQISIGEEHAYPMWSWDGMWILMPETDVIRNLLQEAGISLN
jgi:LCP family protein required for cell wall assembly